MGTGNTRVLVADDAVVYRKIVSDILSEMSGVEVVGTAFNGKMAVTCLSTLKPDLLILDIDMPEMDGLEVLRHIDQNKLDIGAVILSNSTRAGSEHTIQALELGAFDFVSKSTHSSPEACRLDIQSSLRRVVAAFIRQHEVKRMLSRQSSHLHSASGAGPGSGGTLQEVRPSSQIVGIGISTGGPTALKEMLPRLPEDLGVPILIVQHMPSMFTRSLAQSLSAACKMEVLEAENRQIIHPNTIYIAPGGKQMKVAQRPKGTGHIIKITDDPAENGCRPAVDFLFRSLAHVYGPRATAVIMTGMGSDGMLGMKLMKQHGAATIAQDKESCVVYGMPKEVIEAGLVDVVAPLAAIPREICRTVEQGRAVPV